MGNLLPKIRNEVIPVNSTVTVTLDGGCYLIVTGKALNASIGGSMWYAVINSNGSSLYEIWKTPNITVSRGNNWNEVNIYTDTLYVYAFIIQIYKT